MTRHRAALGASVLLLILALMFADPSPAAADGVLPPSAERQIEFANRHFESAQYDTAILEYERFLFFYPDSPLADTARFRLGLSHFRQDAYQPAIVTFGQLIKQRAEQGAFDVEKDPLPEAMILMARSYAALNARKQALTLLQRLISEAKDPAIADAARMEMGWINLEAGQWENARAAFGSVTSENQSRHEIPTLLEQMASALPLERKSPAAAGILSILPGAGYLYTNRNSDALTAFLLNTAIMAATWEALDNGNEILGGILGLVSLGFYAGNIQGSIAAAHKYNADRRAGFIESLKPNARIGLAPAAGGGMLMVGWRF